jgi:putative two-component system response regulator
MEESFRSAPILVVDSEEASLCVLHEILAGAGFENVTATTDPGEVLQLCLWKEPDVILLDLHMPSLDGLSVLADLRATVGEPGGVAVIATTGHCSVDAKHAAFGLGARDFITKPFDAQEVILRIRCQLETRFLHRAIRQQNELLEERVRERTWELHRAQLEMLERLALAGEYRDDDTGEHAKRVGRLAAQIADELRLPAEEVELIWRAATLHDIGKIGVSDAILLKPGKLTPDEMRVMKRHTRIGAEILSGGRSAYVRMAERIALTHHEWWDGSGYMGLRGEDIPIEGRIVAIADVFDALIHERPYKSAWSVEAAVTHIVALRGRHFEPRVVDAFLAVLHRDGLLPGEPARSEASSC